MKKNRCLGLVMFFLIPFNLATGIFQPIHSAAPPPQASCAWQLVETTPKTYTASSAPGATASVEGASIRIIWEGLATTHTWTIPGGTLMPGEELQFEAGVAWEPYGDVENDSQGGLNTTIREAMNGFRVVARRQSINFRTESSGSVSESGSWVVPAGSREGETLSIIASADAAVAGGNVTYKYQYVCIRPTPQGVPTATTAAGQTPSATGTQTICQEQSQEEKLNKILDLYYTRIPRGKVSSGAQNNLLDLLGHAGYDDFVCGGYQSTVLKFLNQLKFSADPCERALLDKWEFGPIQAWWGGHQAVVLYPWATNWMETGLVLDPWIEQKPMVYNVLDWAVYFSASSVVSGSFLGVGPSEVYRNEGAYPIFGGEYAPAGQQGLTKDENAFLQSLPAEKRAIFNRWSRQNQKYWLKLQLKGKTTIQKVIADCPLNVSVVSAGGARSGFHGNLVANDLEDVSFVRIPLSDGTTYTEILYPENAGYTLVIEGAGVGAAYVLIGDGLSVEAQRAPAQQYAFPVEAGRIYQVPAGSLGLPMELGGGSLAPTSLPPGSVPEWLGSLPRPAGVAEAKSNGNPLKTWLSNSSTQLWGGLLIGSMGICLFGVLLYLGFSYSVNKRQEMMRRSLGQSTGSSAPLGWALLLAGFITACLLMFCGGLGLYTGLF